MDERFHCYSRHVSSHQLERIKHVVMSADSSYSENAADIFEKYNIYKFVVGGGNLDKLNAEDIAHIKEKIINYEKDFYRCINSLTNENVILVFNELNFHYKKDFWEAFDKCKIFDKISSDTFDDLLNNKDINILNVMCYKNFLKAYDLAITKYIINKKCVSEIIQVYEQETQKYNLPKSLTAKDVEDVFSSYIFGEDINPNILDTIVYMRPQGIFKISDKIKFEAKKRREKYNDDFFENYNGKLIEFGTEVFFDESQEELFRALSLEPHVKISYSKKWVKDNLEYIILLMNFHYMFGFVDDQMRIALVNKPNGAKPLTELFMHNIKHSYAQGIVYQNTQSIFTLSLIAYYELLKKLNVHIEDAIEWFYKEYIIKDFNCPIIKFEKPLPEESLFTRCLKVVSAIETIIKQYNYYVENRNINYEYIAFSQTPINFEQIKTLNTDKYLVCHGSDVTKITHLLYSDQSNLMYGKREIADKSFAELVKKFEMTLNDFYEFQEEHIKWLVDKEVLVIVESVIKFKSSDEEKVLCDIYFNEFINTYHYHNRYKPVFDKMKNNGWLKHHNKLFAPPETKYFNYYLNDSQFVDGPKLRNKYMHGTQHVIDDEKTHQDNYYTLIKLLVLITLKINDDLCTYYDNNGT